MSQASIVAFTPGGRGSGKKPIATLIPEYRGLLDLVNRAGKCVTYMEAVHEGDVFEYRGRFAEPRHIKSTNPNRKLKPVVAAYVVAKFIKGGIVKCSVWTVGECIIHRNQYSHGWKAVANLTGKDEWRKKDSPWWEGNPAFPVMCMKTVLTQMIRRGELPIALRSDTDLSLSDDEPIDSTCTVVTDAPPALPPPTAQSGPVEPPEEAVESMIGVIANGSPKHLAKCEAVFRKKFIVSDELEERFRVAKADRERDETKPAMTADEFSDAVAELRAANPNDRQTLVNGYAERYDLTAEQDVGFAEEVG